MDARLQRRVQRYGWDRAAEAYARHWHGLLAGVQGELLTLAAPAAGEAVLDIACGTGVVATAAAEAVGPAGHVLGVDLADAMVQAARLRSRQLRQAQTRFERMDAEQLALPDAGFDLALCALGLMYLPDPGAALRELRRVLRPGGRAVLAVWGAREGCGWAPLFGIVDAEVHSEVCPLFFGLGQGDALARACAAAGLQVTAQRRRADTLDHADADAACAAAFAGGPVALAWSRFDATVRARVQARYLEAIAPWRAGCGYRVPAEYVLVAVRRPSG
ncbi:class I SAM-dependent methyltransferase [Rubrivivax sp. RP6-9]|uniref:class I SAM-dependent methyltransferase n=1 Tax=Rubrivivax sp. RP6-9 TaxID=3415750 RepID=UPI003CC5AEB2